MAMSRLVPLLEFNPHGFSTGAKFPGVEPGVTTTPIWTDDYYDAVDETQEVMMPEESFSESEEEDEYEAGMPPDFDPVVELYLNRRTQSFTALKSRPAKTWGQAAISAGAE